MKTVCALGSTVRGLDIYQGNLISDLAKVKAAGVQYAFLKAFENVVDPLFQSRWKMMKDAGLIRGAYDFFHPEKDPVRQAINFCSIVGPLGDTDSCWLDWERSGGMNTPIDRANGLKWLQSVEANTGKTPGIYGSPAFINELSLEDTFQRYPLWVAHYGVKCPWVPSPWSKWNFWQTTGTGHLSGVSTAVDLDVFNGSLEDLTNFMTSLDVR